MIKLIEDLIKVVKKIEKLIFISNFNIKDHHQIIKSNKWEIVINKLKIWEINYLIEWKIQIIRILIILDKLKKVIV